MRNPIAVYELARAFRRATPYGLIGALTLLGTLVLVWQYGQTRDATATAQTLIQSVVTGLLVLGPLVGSAAIAGERERGTYDALLLTQLSSRQIVLGKAAAALAMCLLPLWALLPLLALLVPLGLGLPAVAGAALCIALAAVQATALGIACSALAPTTQRAALLAVGNSAALWLATLAAGVAVPVLAALNPTIAVAVLFGGLPALPTAWALYPAWAAVSSAGLVWWAGQRTN